MCVCICICTCFIYLSSIYHLSSIDLSICHLYLSSLSLTSYHCHIISVMCWRQLILVHKSWQIKAQKFCKLLRVMLVAWKWPWRDYLGHENWKIMQIRHFFFLLERYLLNNLPIYHYRFGQKRDFIHSSVHRRSNNQFQKKITKIKKKKVFGNLF